jgi:hypothetical protein
MQNRNRPLDPKLMESLKIRKTILGDSLELSGLAQFQGQEVEISICAIAPAPHPDEPKSFMRFANIAATETPLLQDLETEINLNRDLDLHRQTDL